ncbi:MAG: proton-conducting membrane transporter, partial [Oscillospiraceae bacterium]|nr:proton-conducting membrane transporter [Oscillospiraceae bacterium]
GFLSKWSIAVAAVQNGHWGGVIGAAALVASAVLTALYMLSVVTRFYFPAEDALPLPDGTREADHLMTGSLLFLAILIVVLSLLSSPIAAWMGGLA